MEIKRLDPAVHEFSERRRKGHDRYEHLYTMLLDAIPSSVLMIVSAGERFFTFAGLDFPV